MLMLVPFLILKPVPVPASDDDGANILILLPMLAPIAIMPRLQFWTRDRVSGKPLRAADRLKSKEVQRHTSLS